MIRERLIKYLDSKDVTKYRFYKETGLSNGFLDKEGSIRSDICEKISYQYPDLNLNWLLTGNGEMILIKEGQNSVKSFKLRTDSDLNLQLIPIYNLEASAGLVELFRGKEELEVIDTMSIPNLPRCDGAVYIAGDSMYPLLKNGDIVAYRKVNDLENDIFWGEMYLISIAVDDEEFVTVKYIQKSEKGIEYIKLVSENKHHQDKDVHLKKVRALALIKATVRLNTMN